MPAAPIAAPIAMPIAAPIAAPPRAHAVFMTPATVLIAIRLIVSGVITHSDGTDTDAGYLTGAQQGKCQSADPGGHPTIATEVHFGSALLSPLVHSINPNGAPAGSATTATCPP
jgi:hypothetical protein